MSWEIRQGDALERLREMPDESVQCCVTSPPYWGLRDYGVDGQLGLEGTPEEFVSGMVEVFAEVRRVLRADGTCWINIGDSYCGFKGPNYQQRPQASNLQPNSQVPTGHEIGTPHTSGLKNKDLVGIPWMLAFALRADGWYLRRDVIWSKPNPMPESVQDRPTSAHEYLFLLTKSARYFYDAEAIREPATFAGPNGNQKSPHAQGFGGRTREEEKARQDKQRGHGRRHDGFNDRWDSMSKEEQQALGRNKRSVWTIATRPYPEAHFATFPPDLVEPCILAGTPPKACGVCGAPWVRQVERTRYGRYHDHTEELTKGHRTKGGMNGRELAAKYSPPRTVGWQATCAHPDDSGRAVLLDPFAGAATTGLVAARHNRDFIGIELNPEYVKLGRHRIRDDAPLINTPAEVEPVSISGGGL